MNSLSGEYSYSFRPIHEEDWVELAHVDLAPAGCGAEPREENWSDFSFKTSIFVTGELKQTWLYQAPRH